MGTFVPGTKEEQQALLEASGYTSFDDLFSVIPASVYLKKPFDGMPKPSFAEVSRNFNIIDLIRNAEIVYQE